MTPNLGRLGDYATKYLKLKRKTKGGLCRKSRLRRTDTALEHRYRDIY